MRNFILLILTALMLTACATPTAENAPTMEPASPVQPSVAAPLQTGEAPAPEETAENNQTQGLAQSGAVTYRIVPEESKITYEVGETFFNQNNRFNTAIGSTTGVAGEIFIDQQNPLASSLGPLTVDISGLTSDSARRDGAIRDRFLQTAIFPTVTFTPREITGLPASYTPGEPVSFLVSGDLTIREVTMPAVFQVNGTLTEDVITGTAETSFLMSEFGFGPIEMAGILGTEDEVKITVEYTARP